VKLPDGEFTLQHVNAAMPKMPECRTWSLAWSARAALHKDAVARSTEVDRRVWDLSAGQSGSTLPATLVPERRGRAEGKEAPGAKPGGLVHHSAFAAFRHFR
jgi:hypothetical protein